MAAVETETKSKTMEVRTIILMTVKHIEQMTMSFKPALFG